MKKQRVLWLDYARSFAILAVLLVHSAEAGYNIGFDKLDTLGTASSIFRVLCFTIGRLGVPFFLMISGYLLLDRDYSSADKIKRFYKNNLLPLLLTVEIWMVLYYIWRVFALKQEVPAEDLIYSMLFVKPEAYSHFWYMPMILGMYIALPFVANAIKNISAKMILVPVGVVFVFYYVIRCINIFNKMHGEELVLERVPALDFLGGMYGIYFIVGLLCKRCSRLLKKIPSIILALASLASIAFCCWTLLYTITQNYDYHIWYDFIGIFIASASMFELFSRLPEQKAVVKKTAVIFTTLSQLSLGIYLVHKPVLDYIREPLREYVSLRPVYSAVLFACVLAISFVITFIISKIPKVRRLLILVK